MTSNIIESDFVRLNISFIFLIIIFIFPLLIVISDISLSLYFTLFIGFCYGIYTEKIINEIPVGIPLAKVIWTKHWEEESIKNVLTHPSIINNYNPINLFIIYMESYVSSWDELQVNSLDNTYQTLYNYNRVKPVQGIYLDYRYREFPN